MLLHDNEIQKILNAPQLNGFLIGGAVLRQASSDGWSEAILGVIWVLRWQFRTARWGTYATAR